VAIAADGDSANISAVLSELHGETRSLFDRLVASQERESQLRTRVATTDDALSRLQALHTELQTQLHAAVAGRAEVSQGGRM
jgi:hypothetical protein